MSAYFVSKATIDCIVSAAIQLQVRSGYITALDADTIGRLLWEENAKSLRARYGHADTHWREDFAEIGLYRHKERTDPPWTIVKVCDNYDYQTCEHDDYGQSEVKRFVDAVQAAALIAAGYRGEPEKHCETPEWDAGPWGLEDEERV